MQHNNKSEKPVLSIITAIFNGLSINKLFLETLTKYTINTFELIIIDNCSTDGSAAFFEEHGAIVIKNAQNFAYSYCQNQGIAKARGSFLCFLNNDIVLSPRWDERLIHCANLHELDVISGCGLENTGDAKSSRQFDKKWKRVKYPLLFLGQSLTILKMMIRCMYGNWERFCEQRFASYGTNVAEGILGNNVIMTRRIVELIGGWDERIQDADFDLFMTIKKRSLEIGDVKPCHFSLGVYIHHFTRMTSKYGKTKYPPFANQQRMIKLHDKWSELEMDTWHPNNATIRQR